MAYIWAHELEAFRVRNFNGATNREKIALVRSDYRGRDVRDRMRQQIR